jgi:hypothetical protein
LLARRAGAKRLFPFHYDPDHNDEKVAAMVEHAQGLVGQKSEKPIVAAARQGDEVLLLLGL